MDIAESAETQRLLREEHAKWKVRGSWGGGGRGREAECGACQVEGEGKLGSGGGEGGPSEARVKQVEGEVKLGGGGGERASGRSVPRVGGQGEEGVGTRERGGGR